MVLDKVHAREEGDDHGCWGLEERGCVCLEGGMGGVGGREDGSLNERVQSGTYVHSTRSAAYGARKDGPCQERGMVV